MRSLQGGERRLTKLGKGFFRDKYYEYLPVIVRGRRRSGRNAGAERRDWLPVNELGGAVTRHPEQVAQAAGGGLAGRPAYFFDPGQPGPRWRRSCASA